MCILFASFASDVTFLCYPVTIPLSRQVIVIFWHYFVTMAPFLAADCHVFGPFCDKCPFRVGNCHNFQHFCDNLHILPPHCHNFSSFRDNGTLLAADCHIFGPFCDNTTFPTGNCHVSGPFCDRTTSSPISGPPRREDYLNILTALCKLAIKCSAS